MLYRDRPPLIYRHPLAAVDRRGISQLRKDIVLTAKDAMMDHSADRRTFETRIVEIVQRLTGLCDIGIGIQTDPKQIASLSDENGSQLLGYEVAPTPKHFQFDCGLVPIESAYLEHRKYHRYAVHVVLRIHLPS